jgi:NAD(P)-dependent dehydrogenase (short-subunit alcohol dehydrogenase family)
VRPSLEPLSQQVTVITGASGGSGGFGLATARAAARRGARQVLASRNAAAPQTLADELGQQGHDTIAVAAGVGVEAEVEHVAARALAHAGRFDAWVNNAGVSLLACRTSPRWKRTGGCSTPTSGAWCMAR